MNMPDTIISITIGYYDEDTSIKITKSGKAKLKMVNRMIAIRGLFDW